MCIAILNPPRVTLKKSVLLKCWENNPDGAGMIFTDTKTQTLYTLKEMRSGELFYKDKNELNQKTLHDERV